MQGLKNVRHRRTDALTRVGWDQLETMLAVYYRGQGYAVEHCGTGGTGARFDGGIDLKLRKDDACILVQCKHWNAKQVPHNDVHQLIGLMVNQGATGATLVTSGEFTRAAIEAAMKQGHVQLVDGEDLRAMLGPLPDAPVTAAASARGVLGSVASTVGARLLDAAEDRIRHGPGGRRHGGRGRHRLVTSLSAGLGILALKILFAILIIWWLSSTLQSALKPLTAPASARPPALQAVPHQVAPRPAPQAVGAGGALGGTGPSAEEFRATVPAEMPRPTAAELREQQRQADEVMRILEASTPEM